MNRPNTFHAVNVVMVEAYWLIDKRIFLEQEILYTLCRKLNHTVIAEYETKLIPKELLRQKLNEFYALLEGE